MDVCDVAGLGVGSEGEAARVLTTGAESSAGRGGLHPLT